MGIELEIGADSSKAELAINKLKLKAEELRKSFSKSTDIDTKKLDKVIKGGKTTKTIHVTTTGDVEASARLASISKQATTVKDVNVKVEGTTELTKLADSFRNLASAAAIGIGALASFATSIKMSDSITNFDSRLKNVSKTQEDFNANFLAIRSIALSTRQPLSSVSDLYTKIARSSERLGASQLDVAKATQNVSKIMSASGAEGQQASAAILQLGQALSSGVLQGDELRSISENAPALLDTIAKGMKVSREQIRLLGAEGKLTSKEVFRALVDGTEDADAAFSKVGTTYAQAFDNIGNSVFLVTRAFLELNDGNKKDGIASWLNRQAVGVAKFADNMQYYYDLASYKVHSFGWDLRNALLLVPTTLSAMVGKATNSFSDIKIKVQAIKINDVIPGLDTAWKYIDAFTKFAEHAFFWLYDRVIGHSWIPDLVEGVIFWIGKLTGMPMETVDKFTSYVNDKFKGLGGILGDLFDFKNASNGFLKLMAFIDNSVISIKDKLNKTIGTNFTVGTKTETQPFNHKDLAYPVTGGATTLALSSIVSSLTGTRGLVPSIGVILTTLQKPLSMGLVAVSGAVGATLSKLFGFVVNNPFKVLSIAVTTAAALNSRTLHSLVTGKDGTLVDDLKKAFDKTQFSHTVRQAFGKKDNTPYSRSVHGTAIPFKNATNADGTIASNTGDGVAFGEKRDSSSRPFGHDLINALPTSWQVPTILGLTAAATAISFKVLGTGFLGTLAAGVAASTGLVALTNDVAPDELHRWLGEFTLKVTKGLDFVLKSLFGGVFGDKGIGGTQDPATFTEIAKSLGDTVLMLGKIFLLFKAGRSFLGDLAAKTVTAPTVGARALVNASTTAIQAKVAQRSQASMEKSLSTASEALRKAALESKRVQGIQGAGVAGLIAAAAIHQETANKNLQKVIENSNKTLGAGYTNAFVNKAALSPNDPGYNKANTTLLNTAVSGSVGKLNTGVDAAKAKAAEGRAALANGVTNLGAGVGGVLGGIGGYELGLKIAEGMTGLSAWEKVAVTMGTAMAGQLIGAGIGASIGAAINFSVSMALRGLGALFFTVPGLIITAIGLAGYLIYDIITNPEKWAKVAKQLGKAVSEAFTIHIANPVKELFEKKTESPQQALDNRDKQTKLSELQNNADGKGQPWTLVDPNAKPVGGEWGIKEIFSSLMDRMFGKPKNGYSGGSGGVGGYDTAGVNSANLKDHKTGKFLTGSQSDLDAAAKRQIGLYMSGTSDAAGRKVVDTVKGIVDLWRPASDRRGSKDISQEAYIASVSKTLGQSPTTKLANTPENIDKIFKALSKVEQGGAGKVSVTSKPAEKGVIETATDALVKQFPEAGEKIKAFVTLLEKSLKEMFSPPVAPPAVAAPTIAAPVVATAVATPTVTKAAEPVIVPPKEVPPEYHSSLSTLKERIKAGQDDAVGVFNNEIKFLNSGLNLSKNQIAKMDDEMANGLSDRLSQIRELSDNLKTKSGAEQADMEFRLQRLKDDVSKSISSYSKLTSTSTGDYKPPASPDAIAAAQAYATKINEQISTGFRAVLQGDVKGKDYFKNLVLTTSGEIIDNFLKGFTEAILGKGGNIFTKAVGDTFDAVAQVGNYITGLFKDTAPDASIGGLSGVTATDANTVAINANTAALTGTSVTDSVGAIAQVDPAITAGEQVSTVVTANADKAINANSGFFGSLGTSFDKGLSWIGNSLTSAFNGLKGLFGSSSAGGSSGFSLSSIGGLFDGMGTSIGTSIGETFGMTGFGGWLSGLFMADGGHVRGAGTSRSDSIPAMLSNGEFVVNADTTAKHRNLLEALNSGKMPKFASGGIVNTSGSFNNASAAITATGGSTPRTKQVFNINVTGDISRQTRNEIQAMIPQITVGVNQTNRESGHSR